MILLDLDGVVVFEAEPPFFPAREIILLHRNLKAEIDALGMPVVVLTHRSRREAQHILGVIGLSVPTSLAALVAAEDIFLAGVRYAPRRLLSRGLRKDLILPALERRFSIHRSKIVFIDDRIDNLQDLLSAGLGLAIHAPSYLTNEGQSLIGFDLVQAFSAIRSWQVGALSEGMIRLPPEELQMAGWRRTGLCTTAKKRHVFNAARHIARGVRVGLLRRSP
jgi:hypothetical protein